MGKRKPKERRKKLQEECEKLLVEYCRLRDDNTCQKCGKTHLQGRNRQVSHVYNRTRDGRLKYDPVNVKILCWPCHFTWWHRHTYEAGAWFLGKFPERAAYLDEQRLANMQLGTIHIDWYEDRIAMLKELISDHPTPKGSN